jgi:hypothetical protein
MLPAFNKDHARCYDSPQLMKDLYIEQDENIYVVSNLFQSTSVQLNMPTEINKNNFNIEPDDDNIIINKAFIVAIINLEILTEFNIPIVSVSVITEKDFLCHK